MSPNAIYIWSYRYTSVENANRVDRKQTSDFKKSTLFHQLQLSPDKLGNFTLWKLYKNKKVYKIEIFLHATFYIGPI